MTVSVFASYLCPKINSLLQYAIVCPSLSHQRHFILGESKLLVGVGVRDCRPDIGLIKQLRAKCPSSLHRKHLNCAGFALTVTAFTLFIFIVLPLCSSRAEYGGGKLVTDALL